MSMDCGGDGYASEYQLAFNKVLSQLKRRAPGFLVSINSCCISSVLKHPIMSKSSLVVFSDWCLGSYYFLAFFFHGDHCVARNIDSVAVAVVEEKHVWEEKTFSLSHRCNSYCWGCRVEITQRLPKLAVHVWYLHVTQVFRTRKLEVQPDRPVYQFMTQKVNSIQCFIPSWRLIFIVAFLKRVDHTLHWQELEEAQQGVEEKMTKKLQMPPVMEERDAASKVA